MNNLNANTISNKSNLNIIDMNNTINIIDVKLKVLISNGIGYEFLRFNKTLIITNLLNSKNELFEVILVDFFIYKNLMSFLIIEFNNGNKIELKKQINLIMNSKNVTEILSNTNKIKNYLEILKTS